MFTLPSTSYGFITFPAQPLVAAHPQLQRPLRSGSGDSSSSSTPSSSDSSVAIASIEFGDLVELPSSNDLMKTLECPVCKEISYPPIFNCVNGHSVCGTCRPKLPHCALCKAEYTIARNYPLESLVLSSKFQCSYKERGCDAIITGENFREHLRTCPKRPGAGSIHQPKARTGGDLCKRLERLSITSGSGEYIDSTLIDLIEDDDSSIFSPSDVGDLEVVSWVKCKNGQFPSYELNPIIAGYSAGCPNFIARAFQGSRQIMGRMIPSEKSAYVYWHGCQKKWYYEVLVAIPQTTKWVDASWGDIPQHAISGGESPDMEAVYIGRALSNGQYVPGYVQPTCQGCYIGVGLQLYLCHDYQVLVVDV